MLESDLAVMAAKLLQRLLVLASEDHELRSHVRALAQQVLAAIGPVEAPAEGTPPVAAQAADEKATPAIAAVSPPLPVAPSPEILEGLQAAVQSMTSAVPVQPSVSAPGPVSQEVTDSDLPLIEERCRLKAEGARWAAKRRQRLAERADYQIEIEPLDREIIGKAKKLPDCFLWMNHPSGPLPSDLGLLDDLAGCFETTADAVALVRSLLGESERKDAEFEQALNLLAEAQSALRVAVNRVGYKQDKDQLHTYLWLRGTCWRDQVYIERYMRISDEADPKEWPSLGSRIQSLDSEVRDRQERRKQHESDLKRIGYHQKALLSGDKGDHANDWRMLIETMDKMVQDGTPPSSSDLRELLLPVVDRVPDMPLPQNFQLVMREVDRFLATRPAPQAEEEGVETAEEVKQVAKWLTGKTLVLIGGAPRPHAREALKRAFGLKEVDWVETQEHDSVSRLEPHVARPDAAVVLLAIRWSSHSFANVKQFCDSHDKPLVRLPGGYNPNQVAAQIAKQCGERLEACSAK